MDSNPQTDAQEHRSAERAVPVIGFGRRLVATLIDGLMILFFTFFVVVCIALVAIVVASFNPYEDLRFDTLMFWSGLILSLVYYVGFWSGSGQTFGSLAMRIRVVSTDGSKVSVGRSIVRYIGYIISALVLSIGFLWIVFDKHRQGWHDKMASTYVIDVDETFRSSDTVRFVPEDWGKGWVWVAVWIFLAIFMPSALLGGFWALGPAVQNVFANTLGSLF